MSSSNPFAVLATLDDDDDEREEKQSTFTFAPSVLGPVEGRLGGGGAGGGAGARSVTAAAAPFALAAAAPTLPAGGAGHGTFTDLVKQHAQSSPLPLAGPTNAPPPTPEPASPATQARLAPPVAFDAALLSQACSQISVPSRTSDKSWDFAGLAHDFAVEGQRLADAMNKRMWEMAAADLKSGLLKKRTKAERKKEATTSKRQKQRKVRQHARGSDVNEKRKAKVMRRSAARRRNRRFKDIY